MFLRQEIIVSPFLRYITPHISPIIKVRYPYFSKIYIHNSHFPPYNVKECQCEHFLSESNEISSKIYFKKTARHKVFSVRQNNYI